MIYKFVLENVTIVNNCRLWINKNGIEMVKFILHNKWWWNNKIAILQQLFQNNRT